MSRLSRSRTLLFTGTLFALLADPAAAMDFQEVLSQGAIPGWEVKEGPADSRQVKDGVLICAGKGGGWIGTKADYTDFIIELEFKLEPGGNSGVFLRAPREGHVSIIGMEVQILDDFADKHKNLEPGQYCGSLYKIAPPAKPATKPAGQWNHMRITADRDHIVVVLNGETIVDADGESHPEILKRYPRGPIGLQNYGVPVWFRSIKLADLGSDRAERTKWWGEAKFGMFIHWGVYSVIGHGEWVMKTETIPAAEYEKLPPQFNPTAFDAAEWVALARRAGQKYMVITTKHHDGFAMYDSKVSDYDIIDRTPFKRDPMKELADECRKQGLKLGFYHSILDWHHPDFEPVPEWDVAARAGHKPDFDRYLDYMQNQVRELCTDYGPLACIWWDGAWDHKNSEGRRKFAKINAMIRELQPHVLINNRANNPEDFATPEQYIPPTGLKNPDGTPNLWENCITLTTGHGSHQPTAWWGYDRNETEYKTPEFCIRMLIDVVSKGGNLLLNVGPTPEGRIQPAEVKVLEAIGKWLAVNGDAIYGTTASPFRYLPFFGKATVRGNVLYLHVFEWPREGKLVLPGVENAARSARLLADPDARLTVERVGSDMVVHLPEKAPDAVASVVAVELDGPPQVQPFIIRSADDGSIALPAVCADIRGEHGQRARYETADGQVHVANWTNKNDYAAWQFKNDRAGTFEVTITYAADKTGTGGKFEVAAGKAQAAYQANVGGAVFADIGSSGIFEVGPDAAKLQADVVDTGGATKFAAKTIGRIELPAGMCVLTVKAVSIPKDASLMNLRQVALKPAEAGLSFGVVADIQYADKETEGQRRYRESLGRFEQCTADWNKQRLAFAIQLGDIVDGNETEERTRTDLDKVLAVCRTLKTPMRHVIGNHCLTVPREELLRKLRLQKGYYDFVHDDWRFVVLDTMDVSVMGRPADSADCEAARQYLDGHPDAQPYNGAIGDRQKQWLTKTLAEAAKADQRVIAFGHHPLVEAASHAGLLVWNHEEIAKILEDAGCVVAYFSGHDHAGGYALRNGVHHVVLQGMVEAPPDDNACGTVHLHEDCLVIQGMGGLTSRSLEFRPAAAPQTRACSSHSRVRDTSGGPWFSQDRGHLLPLASAGAGLRQ